MSTKSYTVRISQSTPEIASDQVAAWLDKQLASNAPLATDPGAGERTLRLSVDADSVKAGARAAAEPEAVFLRRLIASNVRVPEEPDKPELEVKPKAPVLKGALRLQPEEVMPVVRLYEFAQSVAIQKSFNVPEAMRQEAAFTEPERERVAAKLAEVANRRAPAKYVENADLIGLGLTLAEVQIRVLDHMKDVTERHRQAQPAQVANAQPQPTPPLEM